MEIQNRVEADDLGRAFLLLVIATELGDSLQENVARGEMQKAIDAIKTRVASASPTIQTNSKQLKQKGLELLRQKRYEAGTNLLLPLAQKDDDPGVQLVVARAFVSMKRFGDAIPVLNSTLQGTEMTLKRIICVASATRIWLWIICKR